MTLSATRKDSFLDKEMTIEEIELEFNGEWVVLGDPLTDEVMQVKSGMLLYHTKNREELDRRLLNFRPTSLAILYIGQWPYDPNVAIAL